MNLQDRTTATALTVVASAIRGELASWPDAWCMLTDGTPPRTTPEESQEEVKDDADKHEVVVIGDEDGDGDAEKEKQAVSPHSLPLSVSWVLLYAVQ